VVYLETSAVAKLYLLEADSAEAQSAVNRHQPWLYTSRITYAEVLSVLARCLREGRIRRAEYQRQKRTFLRDWAAFHIVELTADCLAAAARLTERHALRGFDTIHLCSALLLPTPEFACFDPRLRKAAEGEGLTVIP